MFLQSYLQVPAPTPLVVPVRLQRIEKGRFSLRAEAKIPRIVEGTGSILDFSFTIRRRIESAGKVHPYARARCFDRHLVARIESAFSDGTRLVGSVIRACFATHLRSGKGISAPSGRSGAARDAR